METFERVQIGHIQPDLEQDRKHFDSAKLQELADSISRQGLLEPLIIEPATDGYRIIAGERRFRACQIAGLLEAARENLEGLTVFSIEILQRDVDELADEVQELAEQVCELEDDLTALRINYEAAKSRLKAAEQRLREATE